MMEKFDWFVLPFTLGLVYLVVNLVVTYVRYVAALPSSELQKVRSGLFSRKTINAVGEVFLESLLHRKIFRVNPLLGYMHASLAFGWFLLILFGNWESRIFYQGHISPPYVPIFFRFFNPNPESFGMENFFSFLMDLTLLVVLSGVLLAWSKRLYSKMMGMRTTTKLQAGDRFALGALWLIFPMRFLAESFASGTYGGGHFLTSNTGAFFASFLPVSSLVYPAWWAYSLALGVFFVALPYSRYMHIPTEVLLIFLRKYGVKEQAEMTSYTKVEVKSCSRCGVCIDRCQMASDAGIKDIQSSYYLKTVRNECISEDKSLNCMMCGRCDSICPVGIDISAIRMAGRKQLSTSTIKTYDYVPQIQTPKAEVIYFAGCMTHLQPSIKKSMTGILKASGAKYLFMDEGGSICCGRPLMLAGKEVQARELIAKNRQMIIDSGAKTFVTSCPICFKVFNEEYDLPIQVLHHSQYILQLLENGAIEVENSYQKAVYHDPCELGRGSGIYAQPREVIRYVGSLQKIDAEQQDALCCGGSIANLKISLPDRRKISSIALTVLTQNNPDVVVTGCPLCKKTFAQDASVAVVDIAEMVAKSLKKKSLSKHVDVEFISSESGVLV